MLLADDCITVHIGHERFGDADGAVGLLIVFEDSEIGAPDGHAAILRVIEPISGNVTLQRFEPVRDAKGKITAYNAWVAR